jgi:hypothetical protein
MLPPQPPATAHYYFSLFSREKANPGAHDTRAGKGVFIKYRRFTPVLTQKSAAGRAPTVYNISLADRPATTGQPSLIRLLSRPGIGKPEKDGLLCNRITRIE